jgi:hypothetical protein
MVRLLRGLFFANYRRDSKDSERQREQDKAAEGGHGDSVVDDIDVRQIFFGLPMVPRRDSHQLRDLFQLLLQAG